MVNVNTTLTQSVCAPNAQLLVDPSLSEHRYADESVFLQYHCRCRLSWRCIMRGGRVVCHRWENTADSLIVAC